MKTTAKRAIRDERGAALVLALVLLLVGSLVIAPVLSHMGTGITAGQVHEKRMEELYAADAGVEDVLWKLQSGVIAPPYACEDPEFWSYNISDINGKEVTLEVTYLNGPAFFVTAEAADNDSKTRVEAYIVSVYGNYTDITNNVLTSQQAISYPPKPIVNYPEGHEPEEYYEGPWPQLDTLAAWYWQDVAAETPYGSATIDLAGEDLTLGPLFRDGDLEITNSKDPAATLTLTGTLYVTGDLLIAPTKDLIIDLNGHAIFVESDSRNPPKHALYIGGKCTMIGPGVIAAMGDIYFEPNIEAGMTDPIFIISVNGMTTLKPGGDFYGAVAGSVEVELQPGSSVTYPEDGFPSDMNWPGFDLGKYKYALHSWTVSTF